MKHDVRNVLVIAQKEFADNLWSPRFISLMLIFTLIIFSFSYRQALSGRNIFEMGFLDVAQIITVFLPLLGIALGFDSVVKERKSASLNILLTHPVYRDNIITGKILGAMITLLVVVCVAVAASVGTMLIITGVQAGWTELSRVLIFTVLSYLYLSIFLALGVLTSIISKSAVSSLMTGICIWLVLCVVYGAIVLVIASIVTDQVIFEIENNDKALDLNAQLQKLSVSHHYSEPVVAHGVTWGGTGRGGTHTVSGIFDTRYTLNQWTDEYWTNIVVLVTAPVILLIISFMAFMRQDISG
ncbi:MAG: ABC transporter permease [Methanosarcinaceae archaeon]|nr:ABC transporter permease [Methanosarcinaceae archaeon]